MKMKRLAPVFLFAGLTIGTPNGQNDNGLDRATPENDDTPTVTITATYKHSHSHSHSDCNTDEPARQASDLQDYHFRGLSGPEAFDEYLAMVGELLDTESHCLKPRYHAIVQPLKRFLCPSFSQLFFAGSVSVTLLSVLFPFRRK